MRNVSFLKKLSLFLTFQKVVVAEVLAGKNGKTKRQSGNPRNTFKKWSGRQDLNLQPFAPHATALPGCATPRRISKCVFY
jgi:hypothetical protein